MILSECKREEKGWRRWGQGAKPRTKRLAVLLCATALPSLAQITSSLVDPTFNPGTGANGGFVESMVIQPDKKILICGDFITFNGDPHGYISRLNPDGSVDPTFAAYVGYWVRFMALQPDGKVVIGGWFTDVQGVPRNRVARLNSDGTLDTSFDPGAGCEGKIVPADPNEPFIFALALQPDGKIIIGGNFVTYNGVVCNGLARINSDGSFDPTFNTSSGCDSWVRSLHLMPNGQVYVTGWFQNYQNQPHNRLMLLNSDGSPVTSFAPYFGESTSVYSVSPLANSQVIAAGHSINPDAPFHTEIVRLNPDGSFDPTFNADGSGADDKIETTLLQPDGKIIIAGYFNTYNGTSVAGVNRLNPDGTLDPTYAAEVDNWVWTALAQDDSNVLICGAFYTVDGFPRNGIARLTVNPVPWIASPRVNGTTFSISVGTVSGKSYALQYKSTLADTSWVTLPSVPGDGTVQTLSDTNAVSNARFYRVTQN